MNLPKDLVGCKVFLAFISGDKLIGKVTEISFEADKQGKILVTTEGGEVEVSFDTDKLVFYYDFSKTVISRVVLGQELSGSRVN